METDSCEQHVKYLKSFVDLDQINDLINKINLLNEGSIEPSAELLCQNFCNIISQYQEQPFLIDPYIQKIINDIVSVINNKENLNNCSFHTAFKFLYFITKVRGFKITIRFFPHEVSDIENVISMIISQDKDDKDNWQTTYILLNWLSILVLLPFHLGKFDQIKSDTDSLMEKIYSIILNNLVSSDKASDAAAFLAAKFLTRPETNKIFLQRFIDWSIQETNKGKCSPLLALSYIYKFGKREDVNIYGDDLLISYRISKNSSNFYYDKLIVKLVQRITLSFLKSKVATWRYKRGRRKLLDNLNQKKLNENVSFNENCNFVVSQENEDDFDEKTLERVSETINFLINCLKHKNINVRWSSAKGIGRITERLPKMLAQEILNSITELFNFYEEESTWHGSCLSLAELARRGLILPENLSNIIPLISKALVYEQLKGNFSTGKIVRDAACYVFWSFSRAFDINVISPFIEPIATILVSVSLFDREINVRRAAAAAFQENVGRLGCFPNGIELVTIIDHHSIGLINLSYLNVAPKVSLFDSYNNSIIDHLIQYKVVHWDASIRELSANAIHNIALVLNSELIRNNAIPPLINIIKNFTFRERHGALLTIANIINAFYKKQEKIDDCILDCIEEFMFNLETKNQLVGLSGDYTKHSIVVLIEKCSKSEVKFKQNKKIVDIWFNLIKTALVQSNKTVRLGAVNAFTPFCDHYLKDNRMKLDEIMAYLIATVKNGSDEARFGCLAALSKLPDSILEPDTPFVLINSLLQFLQSGPLSNQSLSKCRSKAIKCINNFFLNLNLLKLFGLNDLINRFYEFCFQGLDDFTRDSMKDIGFYVRKACINSLGSLTIHLIQNKIITSFTNQIKLKVLISLASQCVSPQDKLKKNSLNYFFKLINCISFDQLEGYDIKKLLFDEKNLTTIQQDLMDNDFEIYSTFIRLLTLAEFRESLWKVYVLSTGAFESLTVKNSQKALLDYLRNTSHNEKIIKDVHFSLYKLLRDNPMHKQYPITIIKTYGFLFPSGIMDNLDRNFLNDILNAIRVCSRRDDVKLLNECATLIASFLRFKELRNSCLNKLMVFLCIRYANVRNTTVNALYTNLLINEDVVFDEKNQQEMEEILSLLSETDWSTNDLQKLKQVRKIICSKLDIKEPVAVVNKKQL